MLHLGGLPVICNIFVATVVLVRVFVCADRLVDRIGAGLRLHRTRLHGGGRASNLLSDVRPPLHPSRRS